LGKNAGSRIVGILPNMTFRVRLEPGGEQFAAAPDETVLDAALRVGIVLPHSCREGRCRSCLARLVAGEVDPPAVADDDILLCSVRARGDLVLAVRPAAALAGLAPRILPARIARLERLAPEVMAVTLRLPGGTPFRFVAGQHVDVLLRDGRRRSFSIASAPQTAGEIELHIRAVPGGVFSAMVFGQLREKDLLRIQAPLGTFVLDEASPRPAILLAGGTGLAPLQSMLAQAFARGLTRPLHLYWGVRARADLYRDAVLRAWGAAHPGFRYTPVLSEPARDDDWSGRTGLVPAAVLEDHADLGGHSVYAAGPPAMIAAARAAFAARGLPPAHFHADSFEPAVT
jgi:CDP-4-dehydro-6-deoxyglucose reductase